MTSSSDTDSEALLVAEPVGSGDYEVQPGDSMSSIAEAHGHFWETLWNEPSNAELAAKRDNPEILFPGDRLTVPPLRPKTVSCATGATYQFRRRGVPVPVRFRAGAPGGSPLAGVRYQLRVGDRSYSGEADGDGCIEVMVMPAVRTGTLTLWPDPTRADFSLQVRIDIGALEPVRFPTGLQARLRNLGYLQGDINGVVDDRTREAIRRFQADNELPSTGYADRATLDELLRRHGGA